jgi:holo-[acyl-carrier protein] synthase
MFERLSIGTDLVSVKRFRNKPYNENKDFYKKIFLPSEIKYCLKHKDQAIHFAGKFAIKEAVIKAISNKIEFSQIITSHSNFKPVVEINKNKNFQFLISISHENDFAIGIVLALDTNNDSL